MKTPSDFLWRLIQVTSSGEKLFFKRNFVTDKPGSRHLYIQLFDAIASQKKYDEAAILNKFMPALNKKNIAFQKNYLQRQVCDALIAYENLHRAGPDIYTQVQLVRLFRKKGLLEEAHATWKKAVPLARSTESFALLNLLKTEFEKMILFSSLHTSYDELHSLFTNNLITYTEYAGMITLRDIYTETLLLKRKAHYDLDDELKERIGRLLQQVNDCTPHTLSRSFWYGHYFRMSKATLHYLQNDIGTTMTLLKDLHADWKKNTRFLPTHGEYYIELLNMINYAGILFGDYAWVKQVFNDPVNDGIKEPVQRANFEAIKFQALNKLYNKTAHYNEADKLIRFMKEKYPRWEPILNADLNRTVNLSLGIGCFALEQYDDALYFVKRSITWFRDGVREEHAAVAHILLLLISYSINSSRLFDSSYRSAYSYFYKRKKKHPFETALIQCLHRTFYLKEYAKKVAEYKKTLGILEKNKGDVVQQMAFSIFNYPGWLMSRVQRISYRQYVERKVKAGSGEILTAL